MADPLRLVLTTFPQQWDGNGTLTLNVVLLPAVDPLPGSLIGTSPSFANGTPKFTVFVDAGLGALPSSTGANVISLTPTIISPPATPATTFALLQSAVTANGTTLGAPPALSIGRIRKALPPSYLAAGGNPPDGNLTTSDDETLCLWDVRTGKEWARFRGHTELVFSVAVSADGRYALSGGFDKNVYVWDLKPLKVGPRPGK